MDEEGSAETKQGRVVESRLLSAERPTDSGWNLLDVRDTAGGLEESEGTGPHKVADSWSGRRRLEKRRGSSVGGS